MRLSSTLPATTHVQYANPSIVEAVWEARFRPSIEHPWTPSTAGDYYVKVRDGFPNLEPLQSLGIEVELGIGPSIQTHKFQPSPMAVRYRDQSNTRVINLGPTAISANLLKPYAGWQAMTQHISYVWERGREVIRPQSVQRIGLRYINMVPKSSIEEHLSVWLQVNDYFPKSLLDSAPGIFYRSDFQIDRHNRIILTLADRPPQADSPNGSYVIDIDRVLEVELHDIDLGKMLSETEDLHADIRTIFFSSVTERYLAQLRLSQ